MRPYGEMTTNDEGEFSIVVQPGEHYVYATPKDSSTYRATGSGSKPEVPTFVGTFYPDSLDAEGSVPVTAYAASPLMGLRLQLQKTQRYAVRGRVESEERDIGNLTRLAIQLIRSSGPESNQPAFARMMPEDEALISRVQKTGKFEFEGVAPGSYVVRDVGISASLVSSPVTVSDKDVDDLLVTLLPEVNFSGKIAFEGADYSGSALSMTLQGYSGPGGKVFRVSVSESGTFALPGLSPGTYRIKLSGPNAPVVTQVVLPGKVTEGGKFELLSPGSDRVVIKVSREEAMIEGRVEGSFPPDSPARGIVSIRITPMAPADISTLQAVPLEPDGTFLGRHLGPDRYQVCAWSEEGHGFVNIVSNPNFQTRLNRACETVNLKRGERERVSLKQISIADFGQ